MGYWEKQQLIDNFYRLDLQKATPEQILTRIQKIMHEHDLFRMDSHQLNPSFFRARSHENGECCYNNTRQIWHPQPSQVTKLGRFNGIGSPLLYLSDSANGAIFEITQITPRPADRITLAEITTATTYFKNNTVELGLSTADKSPDSDFRKEKYKKHAAIMPAKQFKVWKIVDGFIEKICTQSIAATEDYKYQASIAIADLIFKAPNIEILIYPGIATNKNTVNLAIRPDFAKEHFSIKKAYVLEYKATIGGRHAFEPVLESNNISPDGTIDWKAYDKTRPPERLSTPLRYL